jgi:hypothetical protein
MTCRLSLYLKRPRVCFNGGGKTWCFSSKSKLQQRRKKKPGSVNRALCVFEFYLAFFFGSAFLCAELFFLVGLFFLGSAVFFGIDLNLS